MITAVSGQPPGGSVARRIEHRLSHRDGGVDGDGDGGVGRWGAAGLYDTLAVNGDRDGVPLLTLTHGRIDALAPAAPTAAYLRWIIAGLRETHGWDVDRSGRYLARMPGFRAAWTPEAIAAL